MTILTYKQNFDCISFLIFSNNQISKSCTHPSVLQTLKPYTTPGIGGRFKVSFSFAKMKRKMNLQIPGTFWCAFFSTGVKIVLGNCCNSSFGELGLNIFHILIFHKQTIMQNKLSTENFNMQSSTN